MAVERLTRSDVRTVCDALTVGSMNLGVGENGLHSEYQNILDDLAERGIKTSITSNGLSVQALTDEQLRRFHSVELSLDFPTEREHDAFRGAGNWRTVVAALERCAGLRVPVTVTAVMMTINYARLPALARVAAGFEANLRVNVYQPSRTDRFTLTFEQFWDSFRGLAATTRLIATTEPVLAGVLGLGDFSGPGCGRTTSTVFQEMACDIQSHLSARMASWRTSHPGIESLKVAVMGCVVNGFGESKHANIGISLPGTGEEPKAPVYVDGRLMTTLKGPRIVTEFMNMLDEYVEQRYRRK